MQILELLPANSVHVRYVLNFVVRRTIALPKRPDNNLYPTEILGTEIIQTLYVNIIITEDL